MSQLVFTSGTVKLTPGVVYDSFVGINPGDFFSIPAQTIIGRENTTDPFPIIRCPSSPEGYFAKTKLAGFKMSGVRIEGGGFFVEGPNVLNDGVTIVGNEFATGITGNGIKRCALEFSCHVKNGVITDNWFGLLTPQSSVDMAIMNGGNGADATIITANEFYVPAGIHWSGGGANLTVEQNYGEGIVGQFIEIQGAPTSLIVQDNDYAKPNTSIQNGSKYAYSIPVQDGINPIVRRNRAISPKEAAGIFATLMMIEAGGKNLDCSDNYLVGGRNVIAVDGSNATGKVHDNRISDFTNAPYNANNATATFNNNTPTTQLTWDMARPRPARFSRYGTTPVPPIPVFRWPPTINMTAPGTQPADYDLRKQ